MLYSVKLSKNATLAKFQENQRDWMLSSLERNINKLNQLNDREELATQLEEAGFKLTVQESGKFFIFFHGQDRAGFSHYTQQLSNLLCEPPEVKADVNWLNASEFSAAFPKANIELVCSDVSDCRLIETTEVVKRFKPHPSCAAAIKELEQL